VPDTPIRFSESALADLQDLVGWYESQGIPHVGSRIVAEILARVETLGDLPDSGRAVPEFDQPSLRELIHPPFRIVYRRGAAHVQVVRVWRSERLLRLPRGSE
jgi:toxin ParE1/3/4